MKTRRILDPVRNPDGSTSWLVDGRVHLDVRQNKDLLTPMLAEALERSFEIYEEMLVWEEARHLRLLQDVPDAEPEPTPSPAAAAYPDPPF